MKIKILKKISMLSVKMYREKFGTIRYKHFQMAKEIQKKRLGRIK